MDIHQYLSFITENKSALRAFHVSNNPIKVLIPKVPDNFYTKMGYEDGTIARISVGPDVDHCLLAIGNNKVNEGSRIYRVYEPKDYSKIQIKTNQEIIRRKLVPDAKQTKEFWLMSRTPVKEIAKIKVIRMADKYVTVPHGPKPNSPTRERRAYFWHWKVIEGKI